MKKIITLLALAFCLSAGAQCTITINGSTTPININACTSTNVAGYINASGVTSYTWAPAMGLSSTTGSVVAFTPSVTTIYTVTGTSGTCTATNNFTLTIITPMAPVLISPSSNPVTVCQGSSLTLSASPVGGGTHALRWFDASGFLIQSYSYTPSTTIVGTTAYHVFDSLWASGCQSHPDPILTVTVTVNNCTGIEQIIASNELNIYPNPASSIFQVSLPHSGDKALNIKMFDVVGNEITPLLISQKGESATIEAGNLNNGVYFISITGGGQSIVKKVIVQR